MIKEEALLLVEKANQDLSVLSLEFLVKEHETCIAIDCVISAPNGSVSKQIMNFSTISNEALDYWPEATLSLHLARLVETVMRAYLEELAGRDPLKTKVYRPTQE